VAASVDDSADTVDDPCGVDGEADRRLIARGGTDARFADDQRCHRADQQEPADPEHRDETDRSAAHPGRVPAEATTVHEQCPEIPAARPANSIAQSSRENGRRSPSSVPRPGTTSSYG
jgi:hypothetical protein